MCGHLTCSPWVHGTPTNLTTHQLDSNPAFFWWSVLKLSFSCPPHLPLPLSLSSLPLFFSLAGTLLYHHLTRLGVGLEESPRSYREPQSEKLFLHKRSAPDMLHLKKCIQLLRGGWGLLRWHLSTFLFILIPPSSNHSHSLPLSHMCSHRVVGARCGHAIVHLSGGHRHTDKEKNEGGGNTDTARHTGEKARKILMKKKTPPRSLYLPSSFISTNQPVPSSSVYACEEE